jgi:hypothetical protein
MSKFNQYWKNFVVLLAVSMACTPIAGTLAQANPTQDKHAVSKAKPKLIRQAGVMDDGTNVTNETARRTQVTPTTNAAAHARPTPALHYPNIQSGSAAAAHRPTYKLKMPLQGGVVENVPYTPEGVTKYLIKMRAILQRYRTLAIQQILGEGGLLGAAQNVESLRQETLAMINRIRTTIPPNDLKREHNELASTLGIVSEYVHNPSLAGHGFDAINNVAPVLEQLNTTLSRYHAGVKECIAYYDLSSDLDPFGGENQDTNVASAINNAKDELMQGKLGGLAGLMGGLGGSDSSGSGASGPSISDLMKMLGSLGGIAGALGGGSGQGNSGNAQSSSPNVGELGDLGGLSGLSGSNGSSTQGLENVDLNELMKQMGGMDPNALNSILQGLGGN